MPFLWISVFAVRRAAVALAAVILTGAILLQAAHGQDAPPAPAQGLSKEKLEQLVAPIALYPDPLLSQVLMASTYPLEVVQAERWVKANPKVNGKALEDALQAQPWDASVKSLTAFPSVLQMMNAKLDWTQQLGDAFLAQQEDVLAAVQTLRQRAEAAGSLKTTTQQKVTKSTIDSQSYIVIEPQDPSTIYVPAYDPGVVYGTWPYESYPPYSWYPPGYVAGRALWFGAGVVAGAALWGTCNWAKNRVNINVDRYNRFNRTNIANGDWRHHVDHRKGVPYGDRRVAEQFRRPGQSNLIASREQFRGRAEAGRRELGRPAGQPAARQALGQKAAQLPAKAGGGARQPVDRARAKGGRPTAFDGAGSGGRARMESARGHASRAAAARVSGGPRTRGIASGGGGIRSGGGGGFRGGGGGFRGGGGRRSDARLKHDIVLLGRLDNGLGFYRFSYNGSHRQYVGVRAQEAMTVMPQAVVRDEKGYLRVHYDKLGLPFQTYEHWIASGARMPRLNRH